MLSLSAVSPQLHEWLHEQGQDHASLPCPHQNGQAANTAPRLIPTTLKHISAPSRFSLMVW
jgi:hypothetical protein